MRKRALPVNFFSRCPRFDLQTTMMPLRRNFTFLRFGQIWSDYSDQSSVVTVSPLGRKQHQIIKSAFSFHSSGLRVSVSPRLPAFPPRQGEDGLFLIFSS